MVYGSHKNISALVPNSEHSLAHKSGEFKYFCLHITCSFHYTLSPNPMKYQCNMFVNFILIPLNGKGADNRTPHF